MLTPRESTGATAQELEEAQSWATSVQMSPDQM